MSFTLFYIVCSVSGTMAAPVFDGCARDKLETSGPLTQEQCETVQAEITSKPAILPRHNPKTGRIHLGLVTQSACVKAQDA
jgi:hypothetical protein